MLAFEQAHRMDVVVEVGGWEHECCGPPIERGQMIALGCIRIDDGGAIQLLETHHDYDVDEVVEGRVVDLTAVGRDGGVEAIQRVPGGEALRGHDDLDDGCLEQLRTGRRVRWSGEKFRVTVSPE